MRCSLMQTNHQTRIYPAEPFASLTRGAFALSGFKPPWMEGRGVAGRGLLEKGQAVAHLTADDAFGAGDVGANVKRCSWVYVVMDYRITF